MEEMDSFKINDDDDAIVNAPLVTLGASGISNDEI